jgi:hypothetical protein
MLSEPMTADKWGQTNLTGRWEDDLPGLAQQLLMHLDIVPVVVVPYWIHDGSQMQYGHGNGGQVNSLRGK